MTPALAVVFELGATGLALQHPLDKLLIDLGGNILPDDKTVQRVTSAGAAAACSTPPCGAHLITRYGHERVRIERSVDEGTG